MFDDIPLGRREQPLESFFQIGPRTFAVHAREMGVLGLGNRKQRKGFRLQMQERTQIHGRSPHMGRDILQSVASLPAVIAICHCASVITDWDSIHIGM